LAEADVMNPMLLVAIHRVVREDDGQMMVLAKPAKTIEYPIPSDPQGEAKALYELGADIGGWIDEFDGDNIDIVIQVRPDPAAQRTVKDGELR
jgi:hypothetical protein